MRVLVTGGAGYIGSHACKAFARAGYEPVTFDNLSRGRRDAVRWGPLFVGDVLDAPALDAAINAFRPEAVIHFAGLSYVGESMSDPGAYYRVNVAGAHVLLEAMRRHRIGELVFSSSCATYGRPAALPITESAVQAPINTYGYTKLVVERMLADYRRAYGLRSVALRYFNAAGADPDGEIGERHDPETHAIPLAIMAALGLGPAFQVFGDDYPTRDGTAVRDYVHVSDLAEAHVRALRRLKVGKAAPAYNLATGVGTTVKELLTAVQRVTGRRVPVVWAARRDGDPPALYATGARARRELGWNPRFTDLDTIVRTAARWFAGDVAVEPRRRPGEAAPDAPAHP